jgi:hypothetical protein
MYMKRRSAIALWLMISFGAQAQITLLTENQSLAVSGVAGGLNGSQTFSYSQSVSGLFSPFNGSVAGSAAWTDSTSLYPGLPPSSYYAAGAVSQSSVISDKSISFNGLLDAQTIVSLQGPYGPAYAQGQSIFEVSFLVQTPQSYTVDVNNTAFTTSLDNEAAALLTLTGTNGENLLMQPFFTNTYSGTLDPGIYALSIDANVEAGPDPLGSLAEVSYNVDFSVPDSGSFVSVGLAALSILWCHKASKPKRIGF